MAKFDGKRRSMTWVIVSRGSVGDGQDIWLVKKTEDGTRQSPEWWPRDQARLMELLWMRMAQNHVDWRNKEEEEVDVG